MNAAAMPLVGRVGVPRAAQAVPKKPAAPPAGGAARFEDTELGNPQEIQQAIQLLMLGQVSQAVLPPVGGDPGSIARMWVGTEASQSGPIPVQPAPAPAEIGAKESATLDKKEDATQPRHLG